MGVGAEVSFWFRSNISCLVSLVFRLGRCQWFHSGQWVWDRGWILVWMDQVWGIHLSKIDVWTHVWHENWLLEGTPLVHWHRVHHIHVHHWSLWHCWHLHEIWEWSIRIESYWRIINRHENIIKLNVFNVFMMLFLTWWNLSQRLRFLILFFIWSFLCWVRFLLFLTFLLNKFLNIFRDLSINIRFILNVLEVFKTLVIWRLCLLSKSSLRTVLTVLRILWIVHLRILLNVRWHLRLLLSLIFLITIHVWHLPLSQSWLNLTILWHRVRLLSMVLAHLLTNWQLSLLHELTSLRVHLLLVLRRNLLLRESLNWWLLMLHQVEWSLR